MQFRQPDPSMSENVTAQRSPRKHDGEGESGQGSGASKNENKSDDLSNDKDNLASMKDNFNDGNFANPSNLNELGRGVEPSNIMSALSPTPRKSERERKNMNYEKLNNKGAQSESDDPNNSNFEGNMNMQKQ